MTPITLTLYDRYTNEPFSFVPVTLNAAGSPITDADVDDVIYCKGKNGFYYKRAWTGMAKFKWYGAVSDGNETTHTGTDNTAAFNKAIETVSALKCGLEIEGKYFINPIGIYKNNVNIKMIPGSYLIGSKLIQTGSFLNIDKGADNIHIDAEGSFIALTAGDVGIENRHAVVISQCTNVTIKGLTTIGSGGDGFYIGNISGGTPPTHITLDRVNTLNAWRNGISLVNGIDVKIIRPTLNGAFGTLPKAGIDIEPDSGQNEQLSGIQIISPTTLNNVGNGIGIQLGAFISLYNKTVDITITDHVSTNDGQNGYCGLTIGGQGATGTTTLTGQIRYTNGIVINPNTNGFNLSAWNPALFPLVEVEMFVINPGSTGATLPAIYKNGALIYCASDIYVGSSKLKLRLKVKDTRPTKVMNTGCYIHTVDLGFTEYNIEIDGDPTETTTGHLLYQDLGTGTSNGTIKQTTNTAPVEYTYASNVPATAFVHNSGATINITAVSSVSLPPVSKYLWNSYKIVNAITAGGIVTIIPNIGDSFIGDGINNNGSNLILSNFNDYLILTATVNGWDISYNNQPYKSLTSIAANSDIIWASAIPTAGSWTRGSIAFNSLPINNGLLGWICTTSGTPGTWVPFSRIGTDLDKIIQGTTANRPTVTTIGFEYFDTTLGKPVWWNGTAWVEAEPIATTANVGTVKKSAALTGTAPTAVTQTSPAAAASYTQADIQKMVDDITNLTTQLNRAIAYNGVLITNLQAAGIQT